MNMESRPVIRFGLLQQMLAGFAAGALLVIGLLWLGDSMLRETSRQLVATLEHHVRPLAGLHRLQARLDGVRNLELELSRLHDVFVVQAHAARLDSEIQALEGELGEFAGRLALHSPRDAGRLTGHWLEYRERLVEQVRLAREMDMPGVERITTSGSYLPFTSIQSLLREVSVRTEQNAESAYLETVREQDRQRAMLLLLVAVASSGLLAGLAWSGRTVVRRVRTLREHARGLAAGDPGGRVGIGGRDEIGDLARAFETMREQVQAREAALHHAREELELRVEARTADLREANRNLRLLSQAVEQSPVGILIADAGGVVRFANPAYRRIGELPLSPENILLVDALANEPNVQNAGSDLNGVIGEVARTGESWEGERQITRNSGEVVWERVRVTPVFDDTAVVSHLVLSREDITEGRSQQEKIAWQAHFDSLTGLPNRALAIDRLFQATGRSQRDGSRVGAMFIDLDNFKQINDTLGHAAGDELLRQAAQRLAGAVRREDTVARLGGDEFLLVLGGLSRGDETVEVAEKIIAAFASPFQIDERELVTTPSIGIAVFPDDGDDPMVLLRNADLAMYEAKDAGRNAFRFFNQAIHDQSLRRLEVGRCLRGALSRGEIFVVYHPLIDALSGRVVGAEALMRWHSAELGNVTPDTFIPVAEQNGMIIELGAWILAEACATLSRWQQRQKDFVMAVNVSPRQFRAPGFVDSVAECLAAHGLSPSQLEIEITEGLLLRNQAEASRLLGELHDLGVRLSMDDFGTGYSSLSYLRQFPFHTVKIDRSFVRDLAEDRLDRALVIAAVRMAQAMGMRIVAEGVETDEQWAFLADEACDTLQGFRFGQPVREAEFAPRWLNAQVGRLLPETMAAAM